MKTETTIRKVLTTAFLLVTMTQAPQSLNAQIIPIGEPGSELFYQRLLHQKTSSDSAAIDYQVAPYVSLSNYNYQGSFNYWNKSNTVAGENSLRIYLSPSSEINSEQERRTGSVTRFRGGVTALLSEKVSVMSSFLLDQGLADDPLYTGKVWRGLAGDVETALLSYRNERLTVLVGRYRTSWGPQFTNLLLSQTAAPLDGASFRYKLGRKLTFSYQIARLDPISPDTDSGNVFVNRYLAAHRVDYRVSNSVRIGVFESVLFAGPGRGLELQFLNPLIVFHGNQLNEDNNDNTFLGIDYDISPRHNLNFFGQLVVDDFQIEKVTQGDQEPNEIGLILGGRLNNALPETDLKLQWTKVTNRTYNQKLPRNRYLNQDIPLAHPLGNDFEIYQLDLMHWFGNERLLRLSSIIQRRGQGRINDIWTEPWLVTSEPYSEPFPTGTVERSTTLELDYQALISSLFPGSSTTGRQGLLRATLGWKSIKNEGNLQNADRNSFYLRLNFSLFLSGDIKLN